MSVNFEILYENLLEVKIAIVHDSLMCRGGAEQVTLSFHKTFPDAPIYTLCYQPKLTFPEFKECDIRTSWLQYIVKTDAAMKRMYFPLGVLAMRQLDVTNYDVVLISSTHCGKYIKVSEKAIVINYCHAAFRLIWQPESYAQYISSNFLKKKLFDAVIKFLRKIDFEAAQRTNYFVCNTQAMADQIKAIYDVKGKLEVINPPVNIKNFHTSIREKKYFLVVSRLEFYKKVDLVVDAFNELGYPLVIVGKGIQADKIKSKALKNIEFKAGLSATELSDVYADCKALIFPQHEDYGITPLEANAAGRPVIAYGHGGVLTTQIPVSEDISQATAIFFSNQTKTDIINAVKHYEKVESEFDTRFIREHASTYDEVKFISKIYKFVMEKYKLKFSPHSGQVV